MFTAALFTIARTWKQPRCPSIDEWIKKSWYIYTKEYSVQFSSVAQSCLTLCDPMNRSTLGFPVHHQHYSAIKKNEFESVLMRWMKLQPIIQNDVSQKEKHQYSILTHIYGI